MSAEIRLGFPPMILTAFCSVTATCNYMRTPPTLVVLGYEIRIPYMLGEHSQALYLAQQPQPSSLF